MAFDRKTTAPPRFIYKQRTAESVRARAHRRVGRFDSIWQEGVDITRLKEGDNTLRVLPPTWEGDHYAYQLFVHAYVGADSGSYLCLRKMKDEPCAICDAARAAKEDGDDKAAGDLQWSEKWACYVIDRDDRDAQTRPKVHEMGARLDSDIAALSENKRTHVIRFIDDPDKGYDVTIRRSGTTKTTTRYLPSIDSDPSPIHGDPKVQKEILEYILANQIPDLLKFQTNEYLEKMISGSQAQRDEEVNEDEDNERMPTRRAQRSRDDDPPFEDYQNETQEDGQEDGQEDQEDSDYVGDTAQADYDVQEEQKRPAATSSKDRVRAAERDIQRQARPERVATGQFPKFNTKPRPTRPSR